MQPSNASHLFDDGLEPIPGRGRKLPAAMEALAVATRCRRGEQIYAREDPTDSWYHVVSGMARKSIVFSDGRRRIVDFLYPGDFFGFSARPERDFDVDAVMEGTTVAVFPRGALETLADNDQEIGRLLRDVAYESISRLQGRILILGRVTAMKKVGAFLVEMARRCYDTAAIDVMLAMSRYDIADYLGLSVETVSRAITTLQHRRCIELRGNHLIKILRLEDLD